MSEQVALFETEVEEFFKIFTNDGETVSVRDILQVVAFSGLELEDPPLMRVLALLNDASVKTLTISDLHTLFAISDPPCEEDRLAVYLDPRTPIPDDMSFPEFLERTN